MHQTYPFFAASFKEELHQEVLAAKEIGDVFGTRATFAVGLHPHRRARVICVADQSSTTSTAVVPRCDIAALFLPGRSALQEPYAEQDDNTVENESEGNPRNQILHSSHS